MLWYVPFEALQVKADGKLQPLIGRFRIRYAPTVALAVPTGRGRNPAGNTAVVIGKLSPRADDAMGRAAFDQLAGALPGTVAIGAPLPAPSAVYAATFQRLIVLDDLLAIEEGPFAWSPVPLDRGKPGSALGDWMSLPWGGPDEVLLPGFHTAAEDGLKSVPRVAPGGEVFLSVCGLMSSGCQTLLLSRWRTGGQTSCDLVREFAQELPHTSPAEAWRRSVFLAAGSRLNLEAEPRVKRTTEGDVPRANHPFFWSGYLLIDSGSVPAKAAPAPGAPVVQLQPGQ
jgi:hypothetical protein